MNYIPAEKLIAEIERQQRRILLLYYTTKHVDTRQDCALQNSVYCQILNTIDSLQREQRDRLEDDCEDR